MSLDVTGNSDPGLDLFDDLGGSAASEQLSGPNFPEEFETHRIGIDRRPGIFLPDFQSLGHAGRRYQVRIQEVLHVVRTHPTLLKTIQIIKELTQ